MRARVAARNRRFLMQLFKPFFLLGALAATPVLAHAQTQPSQPESSQTVTTVDAYGNVTRTTIQAPANTPPILLEPIKQAVVGAQIASAAPSARAYPGRRGNSRSYVYSGQSGYPIYPYGSPAYNNYYYPALPSTTEITPRPYNWSIPTTVTNIPLGTTYNGYPAYPNDPTPSYGYPTQGYGYPAPAYGYPAYTYPPTYGYPTCGYPDYGYPTYGYPAYGYPTYRYPTYPGVPYPASGGIYYNGVGTGSIYVESQNSGYGLSLGNGGLSVQLGNRRSTSTTTVSRY